MGVGPDFKLRCQSMSAGLRLDFIAVGQGQMRATPSGVYCSPQVFRHTAGVWMAQSDVPKQKIAQFLGHTSTRVTERTYARYSLSFTRDAAAALDW